MAESMGKQAISPLVATVLLLAFSVAIGAVVMSWGEEYVEQKADFVQGTIEGVSSCEAVSFNIIKVAGIPQACYFGNNIELMIDNGPDVEIYDFNARLVSSKGTYTSETIMNNILKKLHAVKLVITQPNNIGIPQQVKLTPKVIVGNEILFCKDQQVVIEGLQPCK